MTPSRITALFTAVLLLTHCSEATNQNYAGPALATLKGTMTADNLVIAKPVRLAIAWWAYFAPTTEVPASVPKGIVTDDLEYTGTFPQNFSLSLTGLPPAESLGGGTNGERGAMGVLIAYEDLNGDGQLTLSTNNGPVVDRVLASSMESMLHPLDANASASYVAYVEAPGTMNSLNLKLGYNLLSRNVATPLNDSRLTLNLKNDPKLNLLACSEYYARLISGTGSMGTACGIDLAGSPSEYSIGGSLMFADQFATASVIILNGSFMPSPKAKDAVVTINGVLVPELNGTFTLMEPSTALKTLHEGPNLFRVQLPNEPTWEKTFTAPTRLTMQAPSVVHANEAFTVSWVPESNDGSTFTVFVGGQIGTITDHTAHITAPMMTGPSTVTVMALKYEGTSFSSRSVSQPITIEP